MSTQGTEKIHVELAPSAAHRWMNCPGSIPLSRGVPEAPSSFYADEGTQAHAVAELALKNGVDPDFYVGLEVEGAVVTEEMADFVKVYTDDCRAVIQRCWAGEWWIERRISLDTLNPPSPMRGTSDFTAYERQTRTLHVKDLKFGQGIVVEVKRNPQLRYYALGALLSLDLKAMPVEWIEITVAQPRASHPDGVIRTERISVAELVDFAGELLQLAHKTEEPNAPLHAGEWCRFCPAAGICPELRRYSLDVVATEFDVVTREEFVPPAPNTIPPEEFAAMMSKMDVLAGWMKSMYAYAYAQLSRGNEVPGFKLVETRPTRKWTDPGKAASILAADLAWSEEEIYDHKLKSVAQIEKVYGKKDFAKSELAQLVEKKSSGAKLVPANDPRPAVLKGPVEEFAALLTAGDEE